MGIDSGYCLSKQQNQCSKTKIEFFEQLIDHFAPVINHIQLATTKQIMSNNFI